MFKTPSPVGYWESGAEVYIRYGGGTGLQTQNGPPWVEIADTSPGYPVPLPSAAVVWPWWGMPPLRFVVGEYYRYTRCSLRIRDHQYIYKRQYIWIETMLF
jgi:hypothetical protein